MNDRCLRTELANVAATLLQILTVVFCEGVTVYPCRELEDNNDKGGEEERPLPGHEKSEDGFGHLD